jgi:site-specific DNA recombinase
VTEIQIEKIPVSAISQTLCQKYDFLAILQNNIKTILSQANDETITDIRCCSAIGAIF